MAKQKTTEQKLQKLIKDSGSVNCAIISTFLFDKAKEIIENKDAVREQMKNSFISPDLIIGTAEKIVASLG